MATQQLSGMPRLADHRTSVLPSDLPTAPLPALAVEALGKLESAFAPLEISKAVVRYGICMEIYARLSMRDRLSAAEVDLLAEAQDEMTRRHEQLERAGMLHLVVSA